MTFAFKQLTPGSLFDFFSGNHWASITSFIYTIVCILMLYATKVILAKRLKKIDWRFYLLLFLLSIFVPILGLFINLFIIIAIFRSNSKFYKYTETIDQAINLKEVEYVAQKYGAGGAFLYLMKENENPMVRTKALFVLAQGQLSTINPILRDLLADKSDEIRLLSFNILDQQEGSIQKNINKILTTIETIELDPTNYAVFEKNLARLYWELCYCHLIMKELEDATLIKAQNFALSAIKILKKDAELWLLLGKIHYRFKEYGLAEESFHQAINYNIPPSQVLPYLAELKYKTKDYTAVRYYLSQSDSLLDIALVAPVKHFWEKN